MLHWGGFSDEPVTPLDLLAARDTGGRLFLIQNGSVRFPLSNYRVAPFSGITDWGYVNDAPQVVQFQTGELTSSDGIRFTATVSANIETQADEANLHRVVLHHASLTDQVLTTAIVGFRAGLGDFNYDAIKGQRAVISSVESAVDLALRRQTPYRLLDCTFAVTSFTPGLDDTIDLGRAAPIQATSDAAQWEAQRKRRERERFDQAQDAQQSVAISQIHESAELAAMQRRMNLELEYRKAFHAAFPNPEDRLDPELFVKFALGQAAADKKVAQLQGAVDAIRLLRGQPIVTDHQEFTFRGLSDAAPDEES